MFALPTPLLALRFALCTAVAGLLIGCNAGASSGGPTAATDSESPLPQSELARLNGIETTVARYRVTVDPASLQATVEPLVLRHVEAQGVIFDIDIADFANDETFVIKGLGKDADGNIEVHFTHAHPFAPPDFSRPVSGQNRGDLGYTGRLVILADEEHDLFFGGDVQLDPSMVVGANGYVTVSDLLATSGQTNNTFPYVLLADELQDNRLGISNGGNFEGNYDASDGGWDRTNIGAGNNRWTGYDFVHQGQTVANHFKLSTAAMAGGPLTFDTAVVVKYTDPRGGANSVERKQNQLPPSVTDIDQFAYRLPHAALDASVLTIQNEARVAAVSGLCGNLDFSVRDWDALGIEGVDNDVSDEPQVNFVVQGGRDRPVLEVDAPFLSSTPRAAILRDYDPGPPNAELQMQVRLENEIGSVTPGFYYACLRAVDPEANVDASYHYGLNPLTLAPDRSPVRATYQVASVEVFPHPGNNPGQPPGILGSPCEDGGQGGGPGIYSTGITNGPTTIEWNFGGGASPNNAFGASPFINYVSTPGAYLGWVRATNANGTSPKHFFYLEVDGINFDNPPFTVSVQGPPTTVLSGGAIPSMRVMDYSDPGGVGDTVSIQFDWNDDGDYADGAPEALQLLTGSTPVLFPAPFNYENPVATPDTVSVPYQYVYSVDGITRNGLASFNIGGNRPPQIGGSPVLNAISIPANTSFTMNVGTSVFLSDPENDPITYKVYDDVSPLFPKATSATFPIAGIGPYSGNPDYQIILTTYATDPAHPDNLSAPAFASAQVGWVERGFLRRNGWTNFDCFFTSVGVAPTGSSSIAGIYRPSQDLGGGPLPCCGDGGVVATYNSTGAWLWNRSRSGPGSWGYAGDVAADQFGNAVWISVISTCCGPSSQLMKSNTATDLWSKGNVYGQWERVATDSPGNVYGVTRLIGGEDLGGGPRAATAPDDLYVVKYNGAGLWQDDVRVTTGAGGYESVQDIYVDGAGNVYVSGYFTTPTDFGGGVRPFVGGPYDAFLVKYDSNLNWVWDRQYATTGSDYAYSVIVDASGNPTITTSFTGSFNFGGGMRSAPAGGTAVLRLTSAGNYVWDTMLSGSGPVGAKVAFGPASTLVVAGSYTGTVNFGGGPRGSIAGSADIFTLRLTDTGGYLSDTQFGGPGSDNFYDLGVAPDGAMHIVGSFVGTCDFNPGPGVNSIASYSLNTDAFHVRLGSDGYY